MVNASTLADCIAPIVGFRPHYHPSIAPFTAELLASESGRYVQGEHPLITVDNISVLAKNFDRYPYAAWSDLITYTLGNLVRGSDGTAYRLTTASSLNEDPTLGAPWAPLDQLNDFLSGIKRDAAVQLSDAISNGRKINLKGPGIWEDTYLFDKPGNIADRVTKAGRFVGYKFLMNSRKDLTLIINRIGAQFTQAQDLKLWVFHSSQLAHIRELDFSGANGFGANIFSWPNLTPEIEMPYYGTGHDVGGAWYIGYYEDDLTGQAINRAFNFNVAPNCSTCDRSHRYWSNYTNVVNVIPIAVPSSAVAGKRPQDTGDAPTLWDSDAEIEIFDNNFGLNLHLNAKCDLTDFYCRNRGQMADAYSKVLSVKLLEMMAFSDRSNFKAGQVPELARQALNGLGEGKPGMYQIKSWAVKALAFDTGGLNPLCLPCNEKTLIRPRTR